MGKEDEPNRVNIEPPSFEELLYEIGQEDMCDYKPHTNLLCKIFGHKFDNIVWNSIVWLPTRPIKNRRVYYRKCTRCGQPKSINGFRVLNRKF